MASSLGVSDAKGAIVADVIAGSPAQRAGLKQSDVIVALNGRNVDDSRDLTRRVALLHAGDKAAFSVMRDGHRQEVTATIGKRDAERQASDETGPRAIPSAEMALGLGLAPMTPEARQEYGLKRDMTGVVVTNVDPMSDAADKGLQPGDVIVKVGTDMVHSPAEVRNSVAEAKRAGKSTVLLLVSGQLGDHFVTVRIG
jgi:serine protease Do